MCSLCPRKKAQNKKIVRFDSIVDTFSISDVNTSNSGHNKVSNIVLISLECTFFT